MDSKWSYGVTSKVILEEEKARAEKERMLRRIPCKDYQSPQSSSTMPRVLHRTGIGLRLTL